METILLKGKRIDLRNLKKSDAESLFLHAKNKEIGVYTFLPQPYKLKHAKKFIPETIKNIAAKKDYQLGIEDKKTGKIIGMMSLILRKDKKSRIAEIGYWLGKKYWGQGITTEAGALILNFGFKKLKLQRIYARIFTPNVNSIKIVERLGFKLEGKLRSDVFRNKKYYDVFVYGLLKREFKK